MFIKSLTDSSTKATKSAPKLLTIFTSASNCIYKNLALEEWLFRNKNFSNEDILFIWRNSPSVVIGRYQNPWIEANVDFCRENNIKLVRRYSGGGTVYHDMGNFNISILTSHDRHNRKGNLQKLAKQLNTDFNQHFEPFNKICVNSRDDLIIEPNESKMSGTAARISQGKAYHHFTFLVSPNMENLNYSLQSPLKKKIETTATKSIRAKSVGCLASVLKVKEKRLTNNEIMEMTEKSILKAFSSNYDNLNIKLNTSPDEEHFTGF
uniref:BPL/LPL catalytic domain-containing protein n=1 Tax=Meloidogyne hapla TaxID=6305 RepID=A0A1I8BIR9_MELHA